MKALTSLLLVYAISCPAVFARQETVICGTDSTTEQREAFLHRQLLRQRKTLQKRAVNLNVRQDVGDLAILEGTDGVVSRRNPYSLQGRTITFTPTRPQAAAYRFAVSDNTYDSAADTNGSKLDGLGDDDSRSINLPFAFPFYGSQYRSVSVNSDGNLTFGVADSSSADRSLGRVTAGPPRIAALFRDLDPTKSSSGVRVLSEGGRVVISWSSVPEFSDSGTPAVLTFQARLFADGRVELAYTSNATQSAVVGISPGGLAGSSALLSFATTASAAEYAGSIVELFTSTQEVDIVLAAQNFFASHDDSYDYLVLYNTMNVAPCPPSAVACENTVQKLMNQTGYGDDVEPSIASEFGSKRRLQAVLNMGSLDQYPADPNALMGSTGSILSSVKVAGHEAGHLFLSFASVRDTSVADQNSLAATPMLGRAGVHWAFTFNSEASLMEGNRITDNGAGVSPRFRTVAAGEGYSPLDQYLMGFRPPEEVPSVFYVAGSGQTQAQAPRLGVTFNGTRRDVSVGDIINQYGRRTPDSTVSQRRFRFGFVLVVAPGSDPTAAQVAKLDALRSTFETAYAQYATGRATAETTLKHSLGLSLFPAAGLVRGQSATATLTLEKPSATDMVVQIQAPSGFVSSAGSVTIPAGSISANVTLTGAQAGVEELALTPSDSRYETAIARVQVTPGPESLRVVAPASAVVPGVLEFRVLDANNLPYPGVQVSGQATAGAVVPAVAVTDFNGVARFRWGLTGSAAQRFTAAIAGAPGTAATIAATPSVTTASFITSVVNAASFAEGGSPGAIGTIFGSGLSAATQVTLNNQPLQVFFNNDTQINFLIPAGTPVGTLNLTVTNGLGVTPVYPLTLVSAQPGIFYDTASGYGSVLFSGTSSLTQQRPAGVGDVMEVYTTGLGPLATSARNLQETLISVQATVAGQPATVLYSGSASGFAGLYQVNVQVPPGVTPGSQDLTLLVNGAKSNTVKVQIK